MLKVTGVTPHHLTCLKFAAVQGDCPHVGGPQHVYGAEIVDCGTVKIVLLHGILLHKS